MRFDNDLRDDDSQDREISLGTSTILGIFLALALVCAAFFGFGYSLGRHTTPAVSAAVPEAKSDSASPFSDFKSQSSPTPNDTSSATTSEDSPAHASDNESNNTKPAQSVTIPEAPAKAPTVAHPVSFPAPSQPTSVSPAPGANNAGVIVQVSATSRQGDAEALIAALRQKGYHAAIHQMPQDKLFHVQLGPFASKKDADTMRKQLGADGYNAIIK